MTSWESASCSGNPVGRNGIQTREKGSSLACWSCDCGERAVVQLIVVAIVSKGGGRLRVGLQVGLILFFKERVLRGDSGLDRRWRGSEKVETADEKAGGEGEGACLGAHADNVTTTEG